MVSLKYLDKFWRTLEMPLINCEINLILTWSANCVMLSNNNANKNPTLPIIETKPYVPVVTLSTHGNVKLLQQLKSGFKRPINRKKYTSKPKLLRQNGNLIHLIEPNFLGTKILFILSFKNDAKRISNKRYYFPNVKIIL